MADTSNGIIVVNFSHPLTDAQRSQIEAQAGASIDRVIGCPARFDPADPFSQQAVDLADSVGMTAADWQTSRVLINLPALNVVAATVLAELHGRMGYFPSIIHLRPAAGASPPQFELAEILDLQSIRDVARKLR